MVIQCVRRLVTKSNNLSSIQEPIWQKERTPYKLSSEFHTQVDANIQSTQTLNKLLIHRILNKLLINYQIFFKEASRTVFHFFQETQQQILASQLLIRKHLLSKALHLCCSPIETLCSDKELPRVPGHHFDSEML